MTTRALVLGGGGVAGIAWETGILLGIADELPAAAQALLESDVLLGTSAGSAVVAQLGSGLSLAGAVRTASRRGIRRNRSRRRNRRHRRAFPGRGVRPATPRSPSAGSASARSRWPPQPWPSRSGARSSRSGCPRTSGLSARCGSPRSTPPPANWWCSTAIPASTLVDAVAASCAVPGAWPPVTIAGRRYMDGGIGSTINLHLADDCAVAVVLVPAGESTPSPFGAGAADELDAFRWRGARGVRR